jgi:SAM-dependent methyltransferase
MPNPGSYLPSCNVCRTDDVLMKAVLQSDVDGNDYKALVCQRCGLVFAFPLPSTAFADLQAIYGADYTEGQRDISMSAAALQALDEATHRQMALVERYIRPGLALNVGAMNPSIRILRDRGWGLHVVEVSDYAARIARDQWGLHVSVSKIEDYDCAPETYDFIKLGHVIEHLSDPRSAIKKLAGMLKPNGIMLIDTDNARGIRMQIEVQTRQLLGERFSVAVVRRLTGKNLSKRYGRLTPPEHLYNFSQKSLTTLLQACDLEIVRVFKPGWGDATWFPLIGQQKASLAEQAFLHLDQLGARLGMGDVIVTIARRP